MREIIQNFHFLRPWLLLLLILPIVLYRRFYKKLDTASSWEKVCDKNLLNFLLVKGSSLQRRFIFYACGLGLLTAILASAGPCWQKREAESLTTENPLMIVLNLSTDMDERDVTPTRLARAKYAISDLLREVKQTQTGLIVYAGEPFLITPITEDEKLITNLLPSIDFDIMPENGDRLNLALQLAADSFKNGGWSQGRIIVFTPAAGQNFAKSLKQAESCAGQGMSVNVVNLSAQNDEKLQKIAARGEGGYYMVGQIANLIAELNRQKQADLKKSQNKISQWLDEGWYLSFIPLLCCLYLFRRGILVLIMIIILNIK